MEEKVVCESQFYEMINETLFSPYENGTIWATLFFDNIGIWDINGFYCIYNIHLDNKNIISSNL